MALRILQITTLIFFCIIVMTNSLCAQEEEHFVKVFIGKLDRWDRKQVIFRKKDLQHHMEKRLKLRAELKTYGYEDEEWVNKGFEIWNELPDKLEPVLGLPEVSRNLLYVVFHENLQTYIEFIEMTSLNVDSDLDIPLFAILGIAQEHARRHKVEQITAPYIGLYTAH
jgi:hypothetical protein